jgi:large subunit ribosomal protein L13
MSKIGFRTYLPKVDPNSRKWHLVDLNNAAIGRVAVQVADILRGKNKPTFTPHLDTGDHVVAINAKNLKASGNKREQLKYYRYSGYPGGLTETSLRLQLQKKPEEVFYHAVWGMLPKGRLGRKMMKKLHIYADANHPHAAQKPEQLTLKK